MALRVKGHLLDTSILIAPDPSTLGELPAAAAISVISLGELRAGVLLARDEERRAARRARLAGIQAAFAPLIVDEAVAERYGDLLALARSQRRIAKASDLLIIATASATGRTLTTRDVRQAELARAAQVAVETL